MKKERQGKNVLFLLWPEIFKSRYVLTRHVTCTVVTMHSIAESLSGSDFPKLTPTFPTTFSDRNFDFFFLTEHLKTMSLKELNRPTYCATHTDERLALFCDTCNESICRNCALKDHKTHQTQFLEDAYSKLYPRLSQILEQTRSVCIKVEKAVPVLEWMQARVNMKADRIIRDIEDSINTKIKALEQRKSELRAAVELVRVNRKTALDVQRRRLEASREALQVSCRFVKRVLEEGNY